MGNLYVVRCWIHLKNSRADHQRDRCEITTKFSTVSSRSVRPLANGKPLIPIFSCLIFFLWVLCKLFFPIFRLLFYYLKFCGNSFENLIGKLYLEIFFVLFSPKANIFFLQSVHKIVSYCIHPKGQLISKCLYGVIVSTKIATKIL